MNSSYRLVLGLALGSITACDDSTNERGGAPKGAEPTTVDWRPADGVLDADGEASHLEDGEERFGPSVTPLADVRVKASRFIFVEVGTSGVGVIHQRAPGAADPTQDARLANASALDLFWAVTSAEIEVPAQLGTYEKHDLGARGWYLEELGRLDETSPRAICNNSEFQASLRNWLPQINDGELWRLDLSAAEGTDWVGPACGSALACDNPSFYSLYYSAGSWSIGNVDDMKQQVAICAMNPSRSICSNFGGCISHLGPTVRFQYRTENNASVEQVFVRDMTASDLNGYWNWYWFGNSTEWNNLDWRIRIDDVKQGDLFDMGWIWNHNGW